MNTDTVTISSTIQDLTDMVLFGRQMSSLALNPAAQIYTVLLWLVMDLPQQMEHMTMWANLSQYV